MREAALWQTPRGLASGRQRRSAAAFSAPETRRLQPALVDVVLAGRGDLLRVLALEVVALPGLLGGLRVLAEDPLVELAAVLLPDVVLVAEFRVGIHPPDHRLDLVQRLVLDERDEAE